VRVRVLLITGLLALTAAADTPQLTALTLLEPGEWTLRSTDKGMPPRTLCLGDSRLLLQLQHPGINCHQFVVANQDSVATVNYTCPGAGQGRTTVRVETPRLMHVDSQGIAGNAPFDWSMEGRRTGSCQAASR
jgi:hypothetical protein